MKHIEIPYLDVAYPIGYRINNVISLVTIYIQGFEKAYPDGGRFNVWCRGGSGAMLAAVFSTVMHNDKYNFIICHVKKETEPSHSDHREYRSDNINVIIDDFCSSGNTVRKIIEAIAGESLRPNVLIVMSGATRFSEIISDYIISYS